MYIMVWLDTMNQYKVKTFKNCFKILLSGSQADLTAISGNCRKPFFQNFQSLEINKNGEMNVFWAYYCTRIQLIATI